MKKTTLQEVKDGLFISMTPKEKFDYNSQRIQENCNKVRHMLDYDPPGRGGTMFYITLNKDWFNV